MTTDFGRDLACMDDLEAGMREVTGIDILVQSAYHRIMTERGTNPLNLTYGEGFVGLILSATTNEELSAHADHLRDALAEDERFYVVDLTLTIEDSIVTLTLSATSALGPFELVFGVDVKLGKVIANAA